MITTVQLSGILGEKFGKEHSFDIVHIREAVCALSANFPDFYKEFIKHHYIVKLNDCEKTLEECTLGLPQGSTIKIIPVVAGSKNRAIKAIAGIGLLGFAVFSASAVVGPFLPGTSGFGATAFTAFGANITYGNLAFIGLGVTLQGFSALLSPMPKSDYGTRESPDQRASFLFNGAQNRSAEGATVPVVYGTYRVGSVLISAGMKVEQL